MIYKNSIVQFYSKNHKNIFFIVILQRFDIKEAGLQPCFFYVTFSPRRKCELPIPEVTRLRTMSCGKLKLNESEQSLIRRYAPYKSSHSDQDKALQHFSLSLKREVFYPGSDAIADKLTEQNADISALYAELAFARTASTNKVAHAFCFMSRVIRDIDPGL